MDQEELLFFSGRPGALALYVRVRELLLARWPESIVNVRKTQIGFSLPVLYAIVWLPRRKADRDCLMLSLCLPRRLEEARVEQAVETNPGRWTNHLLLRDVSQLDDELLTWLAEAACFAGRRTARRKHNMPRAK